MQCVTIRQAEKFIDNPGASHPAAHAEAGQAKRDQSRLSPLAVKKAAHDFVRDMNGVGRIFRHDSQVTTRIARRLIR
jgi:hypothetical protein